MPCIAVLGCGSIGRRHLQNLQRLGHRDLIAFDPVPEALHGLDEGTVNRCSRLEEVWCRTPAVAFITSPSQVHLETALQAAQHDCHLFIEKPLSHSMDDVDALLSEVRRRRLVTMVGCNMRFHPGPAQVKRWLEAGLVGDVLSARLHGGSYLPRWRPQQDYRQSYSASPIWGGVVLDGVHEIDLALWLLGEARLRAAVLRPATTLGLETDGIAELVLEHTSGTLSSVHLNFVQRNYHRSIEIIGSTGTITWDFVAACVTRYDDGGDQAQCVKQPEVWQVNDMYLDEVAYFIDCVHSGETSCNTVDVAARTLEIALAARAQR